MRDAGIVRDAQTSSQNLNILGVAQKNASRNSTDNCINQSVVVKDH